VKHGELPVFSLLELVVTATACSSNFERVVENGLFHVYDLHKKKGR
jgi:hypothetical protein